MAKKDSGAVSAKLINQSPRIVYILDERMLPNGAIELDAEKLEVVKNHSVIQDMIANFELMLVE